MRHVRTALALAIAWALGMASGCCASPPPRRYLGPPVFDTGPDTPFVWPFDVGPFDGGPLDSGRPDARMDAPLASDAGMGDAADDAGDGASITDAAEDAAAEDAPPFDAAPDDAAPDDAAGD